jgi:ubiquinone/menaquinone biosynthesis C-methylase UbiE
MNLGSRIVLGVLITLGAAACWASERHAEQAHAPAGVHHGFAEVEKWEARFESPARAQWQKPDDVVRALNLRPGQVVVDLGAGTGYFARRFAPAVAPGGQVLALDVEPAMVEHMKRDAREHALQNYAARAVKPHDPELTDASVDVVFLCNTYHHIANRPTYFRRVARALRSGGRVVIVDFVKREIPVGPPPQHKIAREAVVQEMAEAGYSLARAHDFLPYQYFLEFEVDGAVERGAGN